MDFAHGAAVMHPEAGKGVVWEAAGGLYPRQPEWPEQVTAGRWAIRYTVDINYQDEANPTRMRELNRASAQMKSVFEPYLQQLDPALEEGVSELSDNAADIEH